MSRKLLFSLNKKDFKLQYFRGSGKGGQHRNKTDSACRIIHPNSGAVAECQEQRSQNQNRIIAFKRLIKTPKFKIWHNNKVNEVLKGKTIEQKVSESMTDENLKIEVKINNQWQNEKR